MPGWPFPRHSHEANHCKPPHMTDHPICVSLDEARALLRERWNDASLKAKVKAEPGERFIPVYGAKPLAVCNRQLTSPDNGLIFFQQCALHRRSAVDTGRPLRHVCQLQREKKGLGRLRVELEDGSRATVDIMNFHANEKREVGECVLKTGENLATFHHRLLKLDGYNLEPYDNSDWYRRNGHASNYCYPMLSCSKTTAPKTEAQKPASPMRLFFRRSSAFRQHLD